MTPRTVWLVLATSIFAILLVGACDSNLPLAPVPYTFYLDDSPGWSSDGEWIVFHRRIASSFGPPGLYLLRRSGGTPRFLLPGNWAWPSAPRFAPDGKTVAAYDGFQIVLVDVATGVPCFPVTASNGGMDPDWSPDGSSLVYVRGGVPGYPPVDPESTGIHILDLQSGVDRAVRTAGVVVYGREPRWSPDGSRLAYAQFDATGTKIVTVRPDGSDELILARSDDGVGNLQWLSARLLRGAGVLFRIQSNSTSTWLAREDGSGSTRWPRALSPWDAVSPNGREIVLVDGDPANGAGVLFVAQVDDFGGVLRRQLTSFTPP